MSSRAVFWGVMLFFGGAMYWFLMERFASLPPGLKEDSNDLRIYWQTGEALLSGRLPYLDFFIEYPPASIPAFIPPALFADGYAPYTELFAHEMAILLVASLVLVALTARRVIGVGSWVLPAVTFALGAMLLYPVAVTRYDAVVTLSFAVAVLCAALGGRYLYVAYASLGVGAAAKLSPALALLPLVLRRGQGTRGIASGVAFFVGAVLLFFGPALLFARERLAEGFAYHAERGLQVESVWSSVLLYLGLVDSISFEFGSFQANGFWPDAASSISLPVTLAMLVLTAVPAYGSWRRGTLGAAEFPKHAAALVLAFIVFSKVLSPQYLMWLLPLVPLAGNGVQRGVVSLLFVVACWLTTLVFPTYYTDLLGGASPGPELLLARNILLVGMWAILLMPSRRTAEVVPA